MSVPETTTPSWDTCPAHAWQEVESQFSNEHRSQVKCKTCGVPGERENDTGEVFWPAT